MDGGAQKITTTRIGYARIAHNVDDGANVYWHLARRCPSMPVY